MNKDRLRRDLRALRFVSEFYSFDAKQDRKSTTNLWLMLFYPKKDRTNSFGHKPTKPVSNFFVARERTASASSENAISTTKTFVNPAHAEGQMY